MLTAKDLLCLSKTDSAFLRWKESSKADRRDSIATSSFIYRGEGFFHQPLSLVTPMRAHTTQRFAARVPGVLPGSTSTCMGRYILRLTGVTTASSSRCEASFLNWSGLDYADFPRVIVSRRILVL